MIQRRDDKKPVYEPFKIRSAMLDLDEYLRIFIIPQIPAGFKEYREAMRMTMDKAWHVMYLAAMTSGRERQRRLIEFKIELAMVETYLREKLKDRDVIEILKRIVDETNKPYINQVIDGFNNYYKTQIPHYEKGKGLSIGAMTSQFLVIFYLNDVDHLIKEELRCKYYLRYMDDFLILSYDKKELAEWKSVIERELTKLKLAMNPKSKIYNCDTAGGFSFLGYRYFVCHRSGERRFLRVICLAGTVRRVRRRLHVLYKYNYEKYDRAYESYRGYFLYALPIRKIEDMVGAKQEKFFGGGGLKILK